MAIAQRNEAHARYGDTAINEPGRSDIQWPNVSGKFAAVVVENWVKQLRILSHMPVWEGALKGALWGFPPTALLQITMWAVKPASAAQLAWDRALDAFKGKAGKWRTQGLVLGDKLFPEADAADFWLTIANMAERMRGVSQRPSDWDLFGESIVEAIEEFPGRIKGAADWLGLSSLLKWGFYGALALGGLMIVTRMPPRQNPRRRRR